MKVHYDKDCDIELIKGKNVTILGYGSQGHAHALNLKESGVKSLTVGLRPNSPSVAKAEKEGLVVKDLVDAVKDADVIMILTPDEIQSDIYKAVIQDNAKQGVTLAFAHGLAIHFGLITPRDDMSVIMIAPKGPGHTVRSEYKIGGGVPCLIAVYADKTGNSQELALSYATAIGGSKGGVLETSFREECETDLFGEQVVLCGGLTSLIQAGFETLVEDGYAPEMAYFECIHEVKLIVDLIYEGGMANMRYSISNTAEFGDYVSGERVVPLEKTKRRMKKVLKEIQNGSFVNAFLNDYRVGQPKLKAERNLCERHDMEQVGKKLRSMMPWIAKKALVKK